MAEGRLQGGMARARVGMTREMLAGAIRIADIFSSNAGRGGDGSNCPARAVVGDGGRCAPLRTLFLERSKVPEKDYPATIGHCGHLHCGHFLHCGHSHCGHLHCGHFLPQWEIN